MLPNGLKGTDFVSAKHTVCNDHAVDAHAVDGHPGVAALHGTSGQMQMLMDVDAPNEPLC